ncbi:HAD family hydrolase [Aggregicoccus sp. 17bor-14]|uniref:HAD family hydrolase n=1 Tax=Myxococcaceae TaxID=31 RepID=UPI00129C2824|nr:MULTISPECIES: HAD family hydrolase [Myxococcaceae]MBF5045206.1 HAD family hydrolase [Simulacricoccus sp. 17bor-14]MRI90947.1 HAD family hydrolase [Aggregicoccus sp. 17bor-14]
MAARCIVLDFDGTFTHVDAEAQSYTPLYREHLGWLLGAHDASASAAFLQEWEALDTQMDAEPARYGWTDAAGRIVAPAYADPYVKSRAISERLLDARGMFQAPRERLAVLDYLFRLGRRAVLPHFRPEAGAAIEALAATGARLFVVTNSGTEDVRQKIAENLRGAARHLDVRGDAKKYVLCEPQEAWAGPASVPAEVRVAGLDRPVFLHRPRYLEVLRSIWAECGVGPEQTLVCGDIFELDLALPAALGATVRLITRPNTPRFEQAAVAALPRGQVVGALTELVALAA